MVPLVMSTPREENPNSGFEEFATHLSLYDDSFNIVDRSAPNMSDTKGPVPPSVFCPASRNTVSVDIAGQLKVKRKCGRPRNPIPRHKRESHINAEHRRRGKIQDGFRTLKNIVPKYEQASGRDSKADILFKAVDYSKLLQNDIKELNTSVESLRAERDCLTIDIKNYESLVPDVCPYTELAVSLDDCYEEYVQQKTKESWTFVTFKAIMHPLFESYKMCVQGETMGEFLCSVADWASSSLSLSNLRTVCATALRGTCKQGLDITGPYKDDLSPDINNSRSAGCVGHSLTSDSNNNSSISSHCLNSQAFASEHFSCRDGTGCGSSSNGVGTAGLEVYVNTFDNNHGLTSNSSSTSKGGVHLNRQPCQDLVPFSGSSVCSNSNPSSIFSDLYYNLDHNVHHHHLHLARAGIDGSDPWSHLYLRQQHWPHYQNNFPPPSYFHNLKKPYPVWGSQHPTLTRRMSGDITSLPPHYYERAHPLSDRDFRNDLPPTRETSDMLSTSVPYLGQSTHFLDHEPSRQKRPSQSSSESEGSLLNMETFARQATETIGENDKYGQLSPSTDSGISPGSSMFVSSPSALGSRNADYVFPYPSTSSLDHFKLHKPLAHERSDSLDNQLTMSLPSYRDTFGSRTAEQHRQPVTRFDEVRSLWSTNTPKASSRQTLSERLESSTLLAHMLDQAGPTSPTLQLQTAGPSVGNMTPFPPRNKVSNNTSLPFPMNSSTTNKLLTHFTNGFPMPVKQENGCWLSSLSGQRDAESTCPPARDLPPSLPKDSQHDFHLNFQTNVSQTNCFIRQNTLDVKNHGIYNSSWLQHYHKPHAPSDFHPQRTSDFHPQRTSELDEVNETHKQMCYFEMAHQQLLKHHSLSLEKVCDLKSPDPVRSPKPAHLHTSSNEIEALKYKTDPVGNAQTPSPQGVNQTSSFLGQPNEVPNPAQLCQVSRDSTLKQKVRRKSSIEGEDLDTRSLQSVSKRTCNWQQLDKPCQDMPAKERSSSLEAVRETAQKIGVATFGDSTLPF